jgi:ABC-type glycerol-3-phosphate transport system substrate-binding protein
MKKAMRVLAGLCMAGFLLAGCGGERAGSPSSGGLTTIKAWGNDRELSRNGVSFRPSQFYSGAVKSRYWDALMAALEQKGVKVDLTLIPADQMATAFQTLLASGNINQYDWVSGSNVDFKTRLNLVNQGRMTPLNKAIEQYSDGPAREYFLNGAGKKFLAMETLPDGNAYWLSQYNLNFNSEKNTFGYGSPRLGRIRQDWLTKLGLPMPATLDEFYNTLLAFRDRDANGNGQKDEIAQMSISGFSFGIGNWFGLGSFLISIIDNRAVSPWYQPHVRDYIAYMNRLYKAGLIDVSTEGGGDAAWTANRIGFNTGYATDGAEANVIVPAGIPKPYLNPLVIQVYPDTQPLVYEEGYGAAVFWSSFMLFLPATSKNVEKSVKLFDYFVTEDYVTLVGHGIEGYSFEYGPDGMPNDYAEVKNPVGLEAQVWRSQDSWGWWQTVFPRWTGGNINPHPTTSKEEHYEINVQIPAYGKSLGYDNFRTGFFNAFLNGTGNWKREIGSESALAFPTAQQIDRGAAITPDLETYSSELITGLIMGEKSLDNWNAYMADLKRLGLDELIAIYQERMDRAK